VPQKTTEGPPAVFGMRIQILFLNLIRSEIQILQADAIDHTSNAAILQAGIQAADRTENDVRRGFSTGVRPFRSHLPNGVDPHQDREQGLGAHGAGGFLDIEKGVKNKFVANLHLSETAVRLNHLGHGLVLGGLWKRVNRPTWALRRQGEAFFQKERESMDQGAPWAVRQKGSVGLQLESSSGDQPLWGWGDLGVPEEFLSRKIFKVVQIIIPLRKPFQAVCSTARFTSRSRAGGTLSVTI